MDNADHSTVLITKSIFVNGLHEINQLTHVAGNNLSGFASQFANRIRGTAKQVRSAERKSANQKNQTRNGATTHRKSQSPAIIICDHG